MAIIHYLFCDESGKHQDHPLVSFSGVAVSPSRLRNFDDAWRALLRSYELGSLHMARVSRLAEGHGPKMSKGQTIDERIDALLPFADCINQHLEVGLIQAWDVKGYIGLPMIVKRKLGGSTDPYYLAFSRGLMEIVYHIQEDDRLSVICDDDLVTAWDCYLHYRALCKSEPAVQQKMVSLTFAHDEHFPALQAADMVAFLSRHEARAKFYGKSNDFLRLFEHLTTEPKRDVGLMRWFVMFADENALVGLAAALESGKNETKS